MSVANHADILAADPDDEVNIKQKYGGSQISN